MVSFLHLGQNSGNLTSTVSEYTLVLVFPLQIGQGTHNEKFSFILTLIDSNTIPHDRGDFDDHNCYKISQHIVGRIFRNNS